MSTTSVDVIIDGLLKGTLILALAWFCMAILRKSSAATRHAVWQIAFGCILIVPMLTVLGIELRPDSSGNEAPPSVFLMEPGSPVPLDLTPARFEISGGGSESLWAVLILGSWLAGFFYCGIRLIKDLTHVALITRRARPLSTPIATRRARILASADVSMPMVWGLTRPVVILPKDAETWPGERLQIVLSHELAHVDRRDYFTHLLVQIVCAVYWMNPIVWICARKLASEQERACDDRVLRSGASPQAYARHLVALTEVPVARGGLPMARPSMLEERVMAILDPSVSRGSSAPYVFAASLVLAVALMVMLAAFQPIQLAHLERNHHVREAAIAALADPAPEVRQHAAWTLGELEDGAGVEALILVLRDAVPAVRGAVAWALGEIKNVRATHPLMDALADSDVVVREMAVRALGEIGDANAVDPLIRMLDDPTPEVRAAAVWALGEISTDGAIAGVVVALSDSSARVRVTAIDVVSRLDVRGLKATRSPILEALSDPSEVVRQRAAAALKEIDPPKAVAPLAELLADAHPAVRLDAARLLGEIGDPGAVDPLLASLRDPHPDVRAMAVWALDEINVH